MAATRLGTKPAAVPGSCAGWQVCCARQSQASSCSSWPAMLVEGPPPPCVCGPPPAAASQHWMLSRAGCTTSLVRTEGVACRLLLCQCCCCRLWHMWPAVVAEAWQPGHTNQLSSRAALLKPLPTQRVRIGSQRSARPCTAVNPTSNCCSFLCTEQVRIGESDEWMALKHN